MQQLSTQLTSHSFSRIKRGGYDPSEVDAYLDDLSRAVGRLEEHIAIARTRIGEFEKRVKGDEDAETVVQTAFLAAAEVKSKMLSEAEDRAAEIVRNAQAAGATASSPDGEAEQVRLEAHTILTAAKQKLAESEVEAERRITAADAQADQILALARRRALTPVGDDRTSTEKQVEDAREELQRLVFMLRSLKSLIRDGFTQADAEDARLKAMLGEAEALVGIVDGDQVDPATA